MTNLGMWEAVTFSISLKGWSYQHPSSGELPHRRPLTLRRGIRHMTLKSPRPQAPSFMKVFWVLQVNKSGWNSEFDQPFVKQNDPVRYIQGKTNMNIHFMNFSPLLNNRTVSFGVYLVRPVRSSSHREQVRQQSLCALHPMSPGEQPSCLRATLIYPALWFFLAHMTIWNIVCFCLFPYHLRPLLECTLGMNMGFLGVFSFVPTT